LKNKLLRHTGNIELGIIGSATEPQAPHAMPIAIEDLLKGFCVALRFVTFHAAKVGHEVGHVKCFVGSNLQKA